MFNRTLPFAVLTLVACSEPSGPDDHAAILPDARLLAPEQVLNSARSLGDKSEFAELTSNVVNDTNDSIEDVLELIDHVTSFDASWSDEAENTAVWGPWQEDGIEMIFTVQEEGGGAWNWALGAKEIGDADYLDLIGGTVDTSSEVLAGAFVFDLSATAMLDPTMTEAGQLIVDYTIDGETVEVGVIARLSDAGESAEARVTYGHDSTEAGWMDLALRSDLDGSETSSHELMLVRSRWAGDGAGRADVVATEGDLGVFRYFVTECWGVDGLVVFDDNSYDLQRNGDEALCAYSDSSYSEDI